VARKRGRVLVCTDPACNTVHHRDVAGAQNMVRKLGERDRSPPKEGPYQHFCRENRVEVAGVEPAPVLPWVGWLEEISAGQRYYLPVRR
jgi:transposase